MGSVTVKPPPRSTHVSFQLQPKAAVLHWGDFAPPREHLAMSEDPEFSLQRPERDALITLQCTGQPRTVENYLVQNVSSADVEKHWSQETPRMARMMTWVERLEAVLLIRLGHL